MCVVVVWIPVHASYRVDLKKFVDAKAPLNMLNHKVQFKSNRMNEKFPLFSRFWFVFSIGLKEVHTQTTEKELEGVSDYKSFAQLEQGRVLMEGMGWDEGAGSGTGASIENEKAGEFRISWSC